MKQEPKKYDDDDGRVICNMDVEGMPWHKGVPGRKMIPWQNRRGRSEQLVEPNSYHGEPITRSEAWQYTWSALLAGLTIVLVFALTWVLFILFCTQVWLR